MSTPDMVERRARIFRFGSYPGKGYAVTRDEFVAANGESGTIPIGFDPKGLKHYEGEFNALDGRTGTAEFTVEGDEVHAVTRLPRWLDEVREELGLKVSGIIRRATHALRKIDLVDRPHIKDAVFFADEHDDVAMFEGDEPEAEVEVAFADGRDRPRDDEPEGAGHAFAQMHHEVVAGMARDAGLDLCHPSGDPGPRLHGHGREFARILMIAHDHCVSDGGAHCPGHDDHPQDEEIGMADDIETPDEDDTAEFAEETPREKALRERLERAEARLSENDAVAFADSVTKGEGRRAYPVERKAIVDGFKRAAAIDARLGDTVTFADEKGERAGSHLDAFKASILIRPRIAARPEDTVNFADLASEPEGGARAETAEDREKARRRNLQLAGVKAD